ncbi:Major facilitator superfamily domain-containing protein 2B (hMfsd2b) [Durusdinium trenchii]|uniref:Major facilitator superfamily domain-containing protein 2B (HMfsd2b) n=1 Tax=Durusdinium trenchii TaxID=1381693 RepID=A0ABP0JGS7_9DINO
MLQNVSLPIFEDGSMKVSHYEYTPAALLCHFGSLNQGHYMVLVKLPNNTWVEKDDNLSPSYKMELPDYTSTATTIVFLMRVADERTESDIMSLEDDAGKTGNSDLLMAARILAPFGMDSKDVDVLVKPPPSQALPVLKGLRSVASWDELQSKLTDTKLLPVVKSLKRHSDRDVAHLAKELMESFRESKEALEDKVPAKDKVVRQGQSSFESDSFRECHELDLRRNDGAMERQISTLVGTQSFAVGVTAAICAQLILDTTPGHFGFGVQRPLRNYSCLNAPVKQCRRRPWLLFGGPFLAAAYVAVAWLFGERKGTGLEHSSTSHTSRTQNVPWLRQPRLRNAEAPARQRLYYTLAFMSVSVGLTSVRVQMSALLPELTSDYNERMNASGFIVVGVNAIGLTFAILHTVIVGTDNEPSSFMESAAVCAAAILIFTWTVFCGIKERYEPPAVPIPSPGILTELALAARNKAFLYVTLMYLAGPTAVTLTQTNIALFCKYVLQDESILLLLLPVVQGTALLTIPLWVLIGNKTSKRHVYFAGGSLLALSMVALNFVNSRSAAIVLGHRSRAFVTNCSK